MKVNRYAKNSSNPQAGPSHVSLRHRLIIADAIEAGGGVLLVSIPGDLGDSYARVSILSTLPNILPGRDLRLNYHHFAPFSRKII